MAIATRKITRDHLKDYLDHFSSIMPAEKAEIEVAGLDLGDQIGAEWATMSGISYDPKDDVVVVDIDDGQLQHMIRHPVDFEVQEDDDGVHAFEIRCGEGHLHIIRLKSPQPGPAAD